MCTVVPKDTSVDPRVLKSFLPKFTRDDSGCWLWHGSRNGDGYGVMRVGGSWHKSNRIAYRVFVGPISTSLSVLHRCDVRHCVRPDHLYLGTQVENMRDASQRRRMRSGKRHPKAIFADLDVLTIRKRASEGETTTAIAKDYGCHTETIWAVVSGKTWSHLPVLPRRRRQRLTIEDVREIRGSKESARELAVRFGIGQDHVYQILRRKCYRDI